MGATRAMHVECRRARALDWRWWGACLILAASALGTRQAAAEVFTDCGILSSFDGSLGQSSATCAATDSGRGGTASASAAIGSLNADASVFSSLQGSTVATSNATWFDTILINSPGIEAGSSAQIFFGYFLQGSLNASGRGKASAGLSFGTCDLPQCSPGIGLEGFEVTETSGDPAVGVTGEASRFIRFGEVTGLSMRLVTRAEKLEALEPPFSGSAEALFTGTAYWGGILDVKHNGVSVPFTLVTGSGVDLTQSFKPVPLPAALWTMATAAAILGTFRRRGGSKGQTVQGGSS